MNATESVLRAIKDRIAAAAGEVEEAADGAGRREKHARLLSAARELHRCADDIQNLLMRIKLR